MKTPTRSIASWRMGAALATATLGLGLIGPAQAEPKGPNPHRLNKIKHIIVIYQENWSFDSLYGQFPGAHGLAYGFDTLPQLDGSATPPYSTLIYQMPQALDANGNPDAHFPPLNGQLPLPLIPYDFTKYVPGTGVTGDIVHRFYHQQLQIDNGVLEPKNGDMDKFVTWSDNPGLVLSYADATDMPEGKLAQEFVLCDNFYHSAYGGSFLNHQFLVAAATPRWQQPIPAGFQSSYDPATKNLKDKNLTIDGQYVVNTTYGALTPHPSSTPAASLLLPINNVDPSRTDYMPTIGNRLDDAGIRWKWYSGGWSNALAGHADPLFQYHHQAFGYYAKYAPFNPDGTLNPHTTGPNAHLQDEHNFLQDLAANNLPAVSFIKPLGPDNEHPGYASLLQGQQHVADLVAAIRHSPAWRDTAIIITYDENGGRWDHVVPPQMDQWGVGTRVPGIIISPFAKRGYIDSTPYETVSILKFIEERFGLQPLSQRDATSPLGDLSNAFDFGGPVRD